MGMFTNLVLACGYGVVGLTAMHVIVGNWSGIASLGNFAAAFFALPFLVIRAWILRKDLWTRGLIRLRWLAIAAFPVVFLALWSVGLAVSKR